MRPAWKRPARRRRQPPYPPSDMITFRSGYFAFSSANCSKFPANPLVPVLGSAWPLAPVIGVRPCDW